MSFNRRGSIIRPSSPADNFVDQKGIPKENNEDTSCGIGSFHPSWLQKFNTPKSFLFNNGFLGLLNGATFAYFIGCISTLEKRYAFETQVTGIVLMSEELCPFLLGFLLSYFGNLSHRPRFIAAAMAVSTLSSFVLACPYFIYGAVRDSTDLKDYENRTDFQLCQKSDSNEICSKNPKILAVSVFFLGLFMKGLGNTAFYSVGTPYLDDNINKKNAALYIATSVTIQLLGPALGFLLSSFCLQFYEDPFYDPGYGPEDPRWIGAWWLGFVTIGMLMFVIMLPAWLYPRRFPGTKERKISQRSSEQSNSILQHMKSMKDVLIRLYKNPVLICNQLSSIMRINAIEGYYILMPKNIEMQFKQSASKANLFSGPYVILIMQIGVMSGGAVISRFRPRPRLLTGGVVITQVFTVISFIACMLIVCASLETANADSKFNLENECNQNCHCSTKTFTPVCGPDGKSTYFSPCYAGCTDFNLTNAEQIYTNCNCVRDSSGEMTTGLAEEGYCGFECKGLLAYMAILGIGKLVFSFLGVVSPLITLRCVSPSDKGVVIGAVSALYSILAFFPYPLLYGALTDSSCLIWEKSCGKTGNCWIYDTDDFRYKLHGTSIIFLLLALFFDICVWLLSSRLTNFYDEPDESRIPPKIGESEMQIVTALHQNKREDGVLNETLEKNIRLN